MAAYAACLRDASAFLGRTSRRNSSRSRVRWELGTGSGSYANDIWVDEGGAALRGVDATSGNRSPRSLAELQVVFFLPFPIAAAAAMFDLPASRAEEGNRLTNLRWSARAGLLTVLASSLVACAPMSVGPPVVTTTPIRSEQRPNLNGATEAVVTQDGAGVSVSATNLCDLRRVDTIERTSVREHHNDAPQNDWYAGIGGALLVGVGALAVANPASLQPKHETRSQTQVRGAGVAAIGLGAALLAVPLIDYVRVHRVAERKVERVDEPGVLVQRNVRCGIVAEGRDVVARSPGGREVVLGRTDSRGLLSVGLDEVTPADWFFPRDTRATVHFAKNDTELGALSFAALYDKRAAAAWNLAEASACATSLEEHACDAYVTYASHYPDGEHVADAKVAFAAAVARRRLAADESRFADLALRACSTPAQADLETVEDACAPLEQYVADFPQGQHFEAVTVALRPARALYARLAAADARREGSDEGSGRVATVGTGGFIPYAGNGGGPTLCSDGSMSHSSGRGTCSHHGGVAGGGRSSGGGHRSSGHASSGGHTTRGHASSGGHRSSGGHSSSGGGHRSSGGGRRK